MVDEFFFIVVWLSDKLFLSGNVVIKVPRHKEKNQSESLCYFALIHYLLGLTLLET